MRDLVELSDFWDSHASEELVLCTIISKINSGYRKVGAKKIVSHRGASYGLLSGGCLEADIERTARERYVDLPLVARFSTMEEGDAVFGYQAGCAGAIDILFEKLPSNVEAKALYIPFGHNQRSAGVSISLQAESLGHRNFVSEPQEGDFFDPWKVPVTLSVIGCGADAPSFGELAVPLGWEVRFFDYRPSFVLPSKLLPLKAEILDVDSIAKQVPTGNSSAVIIMTHNYEADMRVLAGLNGGHYAYVGCLGPRKRFEQMKKDLFKNHSIEITTGWEKCVCSPAGLFNGSHPEEIALSVLAQVQTVLKDRERQ